MERVGFIGLGIMGKPMVRNLLKAGFEVVVHNRSREAVDAAGRRVGRRSPRPTTPREVAEQTKTVITMLPDSPDVREVVFGENGLLEAMGDGHLLIDMSTIAPATAIEVNAALAERGASALDAPVSGGDKGAIAGHAEHHGRRRGGGRRAGDAALRGDGQDDRPRRRTRRGADRQGLQPGRRRAQLRRGQRGAGARGEGRRRSAEDRPGAERRAGRTAACWRCAGRR